MSRTTPPNSRRVPMIRRVWIGWSLGACTSSPIPMLTLSGAQAPHAIVGCVRVGSIGTRRWNQIRGPTLLNWQTGWTGLGLHQVWVSSRSTQAHKGQWGRWGRTAQPTQARPKGPRNSETKVRLAARGSEHHMHVSWLLVSRILGGGSRGESIPRARLDLY